MDAITITNGKAEMAYVGDKPWHGLGQELAIGADLDTWRREAGMDWSIKRGIVRYATGRGDTLEAMKLQEKPDSHVLFRGDNGAPLGMVSDRYKVVQPREVLEFFRDLTEESGYTMNTAGTLFGGKRFWALASIGEDACVLGEDKIGGYLLLSSSCDGSLKTSARFTTVRVVCNNTLSMALASKSRKEVAISHRSAFNSDVVKNELGLARGQWAEFLTASRLLATVPVSLPDANEFIKSLLVDSKSSTEETVESSRPFRVMTNLYLAGPGSRMPGAKGTAWGLVNAVTGYVDHHAKARSTSHRMAAAWFGRGDDMKSEAFERALALAA